MKCKLLMAVIGISICAAATAADKKEPARLSLVLPGASKHSVSRDNLVILVIEGPYVSADKKQIPEGGLIEYVNTELKVKNVDHVGVYVRKGVKYGDVVHWLDTLRQSNAKEVGISMTEIEEGREP